MTDPGGARETSRWSEANTYSRSAERRSPATGGVRYPAARSSGLKAACLAEWRASPPETSPHAQPTCRRICPQRPPLSPIQISPIAPKSPASPPQRWSGRTRPTRRPPTSTDGGANHSLKLYELGCLATWPRGRCRSRGKAAPRPCSRQPLRDSHRMVEFYSLARLAANKRGASGFERCRTRTRPLRGHSFTGIGVLLRAHRDFRPRFVFLDGDHTEEGVGRNLAALARRVPASSRETPAGTDGAALGPSGRGQLAEGCFPDREVLPLGEAVADALYAGLHQPLTQ
jgi:hypothetical protein